MEDFGFVKKEGGKEKLIQYDLNCFFIFRRPSLVEKKFSMLLYAF